MAAQVARVLSARTKVSTVTVPGLCPRTETWREDTLGGAVPGD
jgi:hypothetical protein